MPELRVSAVLYGMGRGLEKEQTSTSSYPHLILSMHAG